MNNKQFIIGIGGGSASGKTMFAKQLADALTERNAKVLHMDDYFKPREFWPDGKAPITGKTYTDINHPDTLDLPRFKDDLATAREDIVIAEGLFILADEDIYNKIDLKIFVDCQADERMVRRMRRYNTEWDNPPSVDLLLGELSDFYLDLVRYRHGEYIEPFKWRADIILNGSKPSQRALEMVKRYVLDNIAV